MPLQRPEIKASAPLAGEIEATPAATPGAANDQETDHTISNNIVERCSAIHIAQILAGWLAKIVGAWKNPSSMFQRRGEYAAEARGVYDLQPQYRSSAVRRQVPPILGDNPDPLLREGGRRAGRVQ
ncbi:MAG: hypothetical protein U0V87_03825 [Acidobacteriota bacterium]